MAADLYKHSSAPPRTAETELLELGRVFRTLMNTTQYDMLITDLKGRFLEANPAACRRLGYRKAELLRLTLSDIVAPDLRVAARRLILSGSLEKGFVESRHRRRNGSEFPVEVSVRRIIYRGRPAMLGIVRDLTEVKKDRKDLAEREARFMSIVDNAPVYIFMYEAGKMVYANKLALRTFGGERPEDLYGRPAAGLVRPEYRKLLKERIDTRTEGKGGLPVVHLKLRGLDGSVRDVAMQSLRTSRRTVTFGVDIGNLKDAEARIVESERLYRMLAESIPDYIYLLERDGRVVYRNRYLPQFGKDPLGRLQHEIFPPAAAKKHLEVINTVFSTGKISNRVEHIEKSGDFKDDIYMENRLIPLLGAGGGRSCLLGITRDITRRVRTENELKASNSELALFGAMDSILLRCRGDDVYGAMAALFTRTFPADRGIFGYIDETTGDHIVPCLPPRAAENCGNRTLPLRFRPGDRKGSVFFAATGATASPIRIKRPHPFPGKGAAPREAASVGVFFNRKAIGFITLGRENGSFSDSDLRRLERIAQHLAPVLNAKLEHQKQEAENQRMVTEFIDAQRIESLGVVAAGIAHDFNNMLAGIMGNLSLLDMELPAKRGQWREMTAEAMEATENARHLAKQLITFSKSGPPSKKRVDLDGLLRKTALFATRGANCSVEFHIEKGLWPIDGDETQLAQALHNLVINAAQAMPSGGKIRITAENEPGTPPDRTRRREAAPPEVTLSVSDTGTGIPPEALKKIFEPFFSTKAGGRGLGLTMVRTIVARHNGRISIRSAPEKGACFTLCFPAACTRPEKRQAPALGGPRPGGGGKILAMEDDALLSRSLSRMLRGLGYSPTLTDCGEKTLKAYAAAEKAGRPFKAVIMDLVVPGKMGGEETVKRLKGLHPDAKVILSSGYSDAPAMDDHAAYGFDAVLPKPYGIDSLAGALADISAVKDVK